ncbi:MAG: hypothetical protein GX914_07440 [Erysipelotrichia bacterium]|nr:hypothetical protein [Erysipelotrichia bacterium]
MEIANGTIIGSTLKNDNDITNLVDYNLTKTFVGTVRKIL